MTRVEECLGLVVSGHWETEGFAFTGAERPDLIYDYGGFPPHTYALKYDVPGAPALAARAAALLTEHDVRAAVDPARGLDHGVFVPLKVAFPDADIPLAPLREEGVLILASGMSFHNLRAYGDPRATAPSQIFDQWLVDSAMMDGAARAERLEHWAEAPSGRFAHPAAEHLLPLMVAAGAAQGAGEQVYGEQVLATAISGFRFN